MKRIIFFTSLGLVLVVTVIGVSSPEYRWLMINGQRAEKYSLELLANEPVETPEWAIDLVVVKKDGIVTIADHGSEKSYVYIPKDIAAKMEIIADHIYGNWYVSKNGI